MPQSRSLDKTKIFSGSLPGTEKDLAEALRYSRESIQKGSKSFALAARLFDRKTRDGAMALYAWCRRMDDIVDGSHLGFPEKAAAAVNKKEIIANLKKLTRAAYAGEKMTDPAFTALQYAAWAHKIPLDYPLELLEGMNMDASGLRYQNINDLLLYCYRVAGVVGLMMSHVMGVSDERALKNTDALGKAMQLTNICRDVMDDAKMGRVYLPLDWLKELGVDPSRIEEERFRHGVSQTVNRVLAVAKVLYLTGDQGLGYLPFRASVAISSARRIYSEIGNKVLRRGKKAWDERQVVTTGQKTLMIGAGLAQALKARPLWRGKLWKPAEINTVLTPA